VQLEKIKMAVEQSLIRQKDERSFYQDGDVLGQLPTSKLMVVYKPDDPAYVYKGPFLDDPSRPDPTYWRTSVLREWGVNHIVLPDRIIKFADQPDSKAYRFPNILKSFPDQTEQKFSKIYQLEFRIVSRDLLSKAGPVIQQDQYTPELLLDYLKLYILGTGDMGFFNTLIYQDQVYVIDYDKNSDKYDDRPFFFFSRPMAAKYQADPFRKIYPIMIEKVKQLNLSVVPAEQKEIVVKKRDWTLCQLKKWALTPESPKSLVVTKLPDDQMVWKGPFNSITSHGYSVSLIKSALQKNIRRGYTEQALKCAFELLRFQIENKTVVSNLLNRLAIISMEDLSPSNIRLSALICDWIYRNKGSAEINPARLAAIVQVLANEKKSRIQSQYRRALQDSSRERAAQFDITFEGPEIKPEQPLREIPFLTDDLKQLDGGRLSNILILIYNCLIEKDINAIYWLNVFLDRYAGITLKKGQRDPAGSQRRKITVLIWKLLAQLIDRSILAPIVKYRSSTNSKPGDYNIFFVSVMVSIIYGYRKKSFRKRINHLTKEWTNHPSLIKLLSGQYTIRIKSYMHDLHTGENKSDGLKTFLEKGCLVYNQDQRPGLYNRNFEDFYLSREQ